MASSSIDLSYNVPRSSSLDTTIEESAVPPKPPKPFLHSTTSEALPVGIRPRKKTACHSTKDESINSWSVVRRKIIIPCWLFIYWFELICFLFFFLFFVFCYFFGIQSSYFFHSFMECYVRSFLMGFALVFWWTRPLIDWYQEREGKLRASWMPSNMRCFAPLRRDDASNQRGWAMVIQ